MNLAVIGDSLTYGFPFNNDVSWLSELSLILKINTFNYGVCGDTTSDMRDRLPFILEDNSFTNMIIFGGANDIILDNRPLSYILEDIIFMQKMILNKNIRAGCILPIVPNIKIFEKKFNDLNKQVIEESLDNVKIFNFQNAFLEGKNFFNDNVHLTVEGNKRLALYASKKIKRWILNKKE